MNLESDNLNFFNLLHAIIRKDGGLNEPDRSRAVMVWVVDKGSALSKVLNQQQRRLVVLCFEHFRAHKQAPSLTILRQRVERADKAEAMEDLLRGYEELSSSLHEYTARDCDALLEDLRSEWISLNFAAAMHKAKEIATSGVTGDPKQGTKTMKGPEAARMYLLKELQSGLFSTDGVNVGGNMAQVADQLITNYVFNKQAEQKGALVIPTGIVHLDETIHGMQYGTLNLILGTAGQRKSALARTFAYNAAISGKRVLFIPLEINFKDELTVFAIIHAQNPRLFEGTNDLSVDRFQRGQLTPEEKKFLETDIVPSLKRSVGDRLVIRQLADQTWANIRSIIELENFIEPLDMVVIDYIGLLDTRHEKDKTLAINEAAIQMKQMALTFPNGKGGLVIVSPVQGSRNGYEEAKKNDGTWEKTGIYQYSELEKSADIIFYTFLSQDMQTTEKIKIGTCKSRNSADVPVQLVPINPNTGYIGQDDLDGNQRKPTSNKELEALGALYK